MGSILNGKSVLLGVTGSIAAYKTVDWVRSLTAEGAKVQVVMTTAACRFLQPLTLAALSGNRVHTDMFATEGEEKIPHIRLGRECDLILIAPATASTIARLANGLAEDLLSAVVLASRAPVLLCPAMNSRMYEHPATQANLNRLSAYGYHLVNPDCGLMACGEEGPGRLADWDAVREAILGCLSPQDLAGQQVLITAGPTHEPLDPVRYLGNRSSGKMGYALARTARRRGAGVTLISGPTCLSAPPGIELISVRTAAEMHQAVMDHCRRVSVIVKAAAVSDFRPARCEEQKIKKSEAVAALPLAANADILAELGELKKKMAFPPLLVGFAAESRDLRNQGRQKLLRKNLDLIAVNDILAEDGGFAVDTNTLLLLDRTENDLHLPLLSKEEAADRIWDQVILLLQAKKSPTADGISSKS
jgi:phosphopantothenoylcysteine decarboxylase / phosphopantothenate---cysteine ligase